MKHLQIKTLLFVYIFMAPAFYVPGDYQHELRVLLTGRFATFLCVLFSNRWEYPRIKQGNMSIISIKVFAENLKVCALYSPV